MPDGTPSTFRGQLTARLGIHHRYRRDMCGLGNEQHFDPMGGAVGGQNLETSRPYRLGVVLTQSPASFGPALHHWSDIGPAATTVVPESTPAFPGGRLTKS
jgi:hypothetical protein